MTWWTVVHGIGKQHDEQLEAMLRRFEEYGITLRKEKCLYGKEEVKWFRHIFSKQGMSPDPEKVEVIAQWKAPEDKTGVKSFLRDTSVLQHIHEGRQRQDIK